MICATAGPGTDPGFGVERFDPPTDILDTSAPLKETGDGPVGVAREDQFGERPEEKQSLTADEVQRMADLEKQQCGSGQAAANDLARKPVYQGGFQLGRLRRAGGFDCKGVPEPLSQAATPRSLQNRRKGRAEY